MFNKMIESMNHFPQDNFNFLRPSGFLHADVVETEKDFVLSIDVPGLKRDNIDINLEDEVLSIAVKVEKSKQQKDENARVHHQERFVGKYERSFIVPKGFVKENIKAKLDHGVLTLTLNKPDPKKVKLETKIAIN